MKKKGKNRTGDYLLRDRGIVNAEVMRMDKIRRKARKTERPISHAYRVLDNDLARDNVENDLPFADREDL